MYVTAHLVQARSGQEGINAFLHLHGPAFSWPEDAAALADLNPGQTVRRLVAVSPGHNLVRAYLDVLAPDGTDRAELDRAVFALKRNLANFRNPAIFVHDRVTIRFGVELGLEFIRIRQQQLSMLASVAFSLFET